MPNFRRIVGCLAAWGLTLGRAWAEDGLPSEWGNSLAAETAPALPEAHTGQVVLALLLVLALVALVAWWLKRRRPAPIASAEGGTLIILNRFSASQTFMIWEDRGKQYAMITNGKKIEMLAELPGHGAPAAGPGMRGSASPKTFQEVWQNILQTARRSR